MKQVKKFRNLPHRMMGGKTNTKPTLIPNESTNSDMSLATSLGNNSKIDPNKLGVVTPTSNDVEMSSTNTSSTNTYSTNTSSKIKEDFITHFGEEAYNHAVALHKLQKKEKRQKKKEEKKKEEIIFINI